MVLRKNNVPGNVHSIIGREILDWSYGNETFLNVIAPPYSSSAIFLPLISEVVSKGKRVLYVTNENNSTLNIIDELRIKQNVKKYSYARKGSNYENSSLVVCSFEFIPFIKGDYSVIIFDDIRGSRKYSLNELDELVNTIFNNKSKFIYFDFTGIFPNCREIILPIRENSFPVTEPRIITTRIDIAKDIPFVVYDYIKWSIKSGKSVIIYVPDGEKLVKVNKYMTLYKEELKLQVIYHTRTSSYERTANNFNKIKGAILITDDISIDFNALRDCDIMVFFADDSVYNYKSLVHLCGKVGRREYERRTEVIFLANSITDDIETAKEITRSFNKEAWERGLFDL